MKAKIGENYSLEQIGGGAFGFSGMRWKNPSPCGLGQSCKPDSVHPLGGASAIYLSGLPSERCEQHHDRFTWPCNPGGLPVRTIAYTNCGLLPHIFTLTPRGGYFLWHVLPGCPDHWFPVPGALCCPDFPPRLYGRSDRADCPANI